jgi:DNA replication ATP-dependent helicase Dna2
MQPVIFCDTDQVPAIETKVGPWIENKIECELFCQTVAFLIDAGLNETDIGIISPYRYQLKQLSKGLGKYPNLELLTVDKFQGKDKQCIIMSLVRSNDGGQVFFILI